MPAQFGMQNDLIRRNHARGHGLHNHLVRTAEARQRRAEAIVEGVHRAWTNARWIVDRLMNGKSSEHVPAANGK